MTRSLLIEVAAKMATLPADLKFGHYYYRLTAPDLPPIDRESQFLSERFDLVPEGTYALSVAARTALKVVIGVPTIDQVVVAPVGGGGAPETYMAPMGLVCTVF